MLHRYFEELQGTAGEGGTLSPHFLKANEEERYYIRQLNLLCHEFESWALSKRKSLYLPEWQRPSQLMCWLNAPRFELTEEDYEDFGIETLNKTLGGVYVGVNKAVGKHHWEVFIDEGNEYGRSKDELTTIAMRSQTQAAGDFDIEWANNPGNFVWQEKLMNDFRVWLGKNGFDPDDKSLTIGHPKCGQVDLQKSFNTDNYKIIWNILGDHLDVFSIKTSDAYNEFNYNWDDADFIQQTINNAHPTHSEIMTTTEDKYADILIKDTNMDNDLQTTETIDDSIMQQVEILMGLTTKQESPTISDNNTIKELKEKINQLFAEYGV